LQTRLIYLAAILSSLFYIKLSLLLLFIPLHIGLLIQMAQLASARRDDDDAMLIEIDSPSVDGSAPSFQAVSDPEPADFLSLPAFRMMCLSNPLLDTFFSSQLPASFRLEAPHRASINGTSIWHEVSAPETPTSASSTLSGTLRRSSVINHGSTPTSAPAALASFPASPQKVRAYSKDVSTGVVGKLGGFLNNFLGEEVKSKVDELADSLGERLNTKVVRGPLPSFVDRDEIGLGGTSKGLGRKQSSGTLGMDDLRALDEQRRERRRMREEEERQEEALAAKGSHTSLRGIDINAAQESLRMATEAIVEGAQTGGQQFREDAPVVAENLGEEEEEEEEEVVVDDDAIHLKER
jgi:hypothetical protein